MDNQKNIPAKENLRPIFNSSLFFKMMFQNAEYTAIIVMDPDGTILDANHGFKQCFGYSKEMLVGEHFSILFIDEDLQKNLPERELKGVMERGSFNDENYLRQADGTPTWVHGESIYLKDENGQEFVVKVIQDINEEKVLEGELKKINKEQERIILDHETFVYTASHDLQAPINNIDGLVRELKENKGNSELLLTLVERSIQRFRDKIKELSDIGREQEEARQRLDEVEFQEIYQDVLLDLEDEIKRSHAEIVADFSEAPTARITKRNLRSIIQNLLSNAIKYRDNHRQPQVKLETSKADDGFILLSVTDNGIGIAQADKDKVFRMYGRLQDDNKGTGVGMAIVRRMVNNLGGKIKLKSKVGEGSTFKIYFPI